MEFHVVTLSAMEEDGVEIVEGFDSDVGRPEMIFQ